MNTNSDGKFGMTAPMTIASYHETQFILAESKFMQGDESGARQHLNNVRSILEFNTLDAQDFLIQLLRNDLHLDFGGKVYYSYGRVSYIP